MIFRIIAVLSIAPILLASCALIHRDTPPLALIDPRNVQVANDIYLAPGMWPTKQWWTSYNDPQLNDLIERALKNSPTIAIAKSRLAQARSNVELERSTSDLQIALVGSVDRQHVSDNGFLSAYAGRQPAIGADGPSYTDGLVGIGSHLDLDLWGRQRAAVEAAIGGQNTQRADEAAAELELAADIAQLYFSMQVTFANINFLNQSRDLAMFIVAAHEARERRGLEGKEQTQQARASLLSIERGIAGAQAQVISLREALRALVAEGPGDLSITQESLPISGNSLPKTLSYDLLSRRPDLQALRWTIEASLNRVEAAKASFYPSFDITAFFGFNALNLSDLFTHASQQINVIPGVTLPLFDGGRLNANLHAVRSASDIAIAQYNQAVLSAVRDVAQTGSRLQDLIRETELQSQKISDVSFLADRAVSMYGRGLVDGVKVSEAKQPLINERMALLELHGREIEQQVTLIKELGGGYRVNDDALEDK